MRIVKCQGNHLTSLDLNPTSLKYPPDCYGNSYEISLNADRTFDLSGLLGQFDVDKASKWTNGSVEGNILTVDPGTEKVTYIYDLGKNRTTLFTLTYNHVHGSTEWSYDGTQHWQDCPCGIVVGKADHTLVDGVGAKEATTTEPGYTGDKACSECGYVAVKGTAIPVIHTHSYSEKWTYNETEHWHECDCGGKADSAGHNFVIEGVVEATEYSEGYTGDKRCACGYEEKGTIIPKLPHTHSCDEWKAVEGDATNHWGTCDCGDEISEAHKFVKENGEALTEADTDYEGDLTCTECGYVAKGKTSGEAGGNTGDVNDGEDTHEHVYGDTWQSDADKHWKKCDCGAESEHVSHNAEVKDAKDATITKPGHTGNTVCKDCGYEIKKGEEIPAKGISGIIDAIKGLIEKIDPEAVEDVIDKIKDILGKIDPDAIGDVIDKIKEILGDIDTDKIGGIIDEIKDKLDDVIGSIGSSNGNGDNGNDDNSSTTGDSAGNGTTGGATDGDSTVGGSSNGEVPNTGAAAGMVTIATLSIAAAAAFVSRKKKD